MANVTHPLTKYLKDSGESLSAFSQRIGISRMQIYRIMNGEGTTTETLKRISAATGGLVTAGSFIDEPVEAAE